MICEVDMYIYPNSTIILLRGVPLDNTYTDTMYFNNASAQYTAFTTTFNKLTFGNQSYQRKGKGSLRLNVNADSIYDVNYLMFQNTSYGNKWFYAFVTDIEYINNDVTEISYEIDLLQTWHFDYTLEPSFVERETASSDSVGSNIKDEPVELGPIICRAINDTELFDEYYAVMAIAGD